MFTRSFVPALLMLLLVGCQGLSTNEQKVVGTWEQQSFNSGEPAYHVLKPDHSYAFVGTKDVDGNLGHVVLITGSWRVKGDVLIVDGTEAQPGNGTETGVPRKRVNQERISKFLRGLTPHEPLSY